MIVLVTMLLLGACRSAPGGEYSGQGTIRGVFHLGNETAPDRAWVEMIELTGPPEGRCGPGDCGLLAGALREGTHWNPGRWRVIPPHVPGWESPVDVEITVRAGQLTTFEADYDRP